MENPVSDLATQLAGVTNADVDAWSQALTEAAPHSRSARLDKETLLRLAKACEKPARFVTLVRSMAEKPIRHPSDQGPLEYLEVLVDPYPFSLEAWIRAVLLVQEWARARKAEGSFHEYVDFVGCCAEFGTRQDLRADLTSVTEDMLDDFGFAGNSDSAG